MEKICAYCQKSFVVKRMDAIYCSRTCRQMNYMNRKIEALTNQAILSNPKNLSLKEQEEVTTDNSQELPSTLNSDEERSDQTIDVPVLTSKVSKPTDENYEPVESELIGRIYDQVESREAEIRLDACLHELKSFASLWVSLRYRCLLECLLVFSDMKNIKVSSLLEVCNAFILIVRSDYYKKLPTIYPYTDELQKLKEKLKRLCYKVQYSGNIKFYLSKEDKIDLIVFRYELSRCIPKMKYSQLDFEK